MNSAATTTRRPALSGDCCPSNPNLLSSPAFGSIHAVVAPTSVCNGWGRIVRTVLA